jgi:opacity protein-like surface antigen
MKSLLVLAATTVLSANAYGGDGKFPDDFVYEPIGMYFGWNYAKFNYDIKGHDDLTTEPPLEDLEPEMFVGRLGYKFNSYLALEGRFGVRLSNDGYNFTFPELPVGHPDNPDEDDPIPERNSATVVKLDNMQAIMLRVTLPVNAKLHVYAVGGYSNFDIDFRADRDTGTSFSGTSWKENKSGGSYGAGINYNFNEYVSVNAEFTQYLVNDEFDLKAGSAGIKFNF